MWTTKMKFGLIVVIALLFVQGSCAAEMYQMIDKWDVQTPTGIAVDAAGNIYVVDQSNNQVLKFDSNGNPLGSWGSSGSGEGHFDHPVGVATDGTYVYVTDNWNNRIQKFDTDGNYQTQWPVTSAWAVAVDATGNVYSNHFIDQIWKFDPNGNVLVKYGSIGTGTGDGQFDHPTGIAFDREGYFYVADNWNHRIQKFDSDGNFKFKWGSYGTGDGQFDYPYGIAVGDGYVYGYNIYVADWDNHRIQMFWGWSGGFLTKWGSVGTGDGQFTYPWGVAVDSKRKVYVADFANNRIQKFGRVPYFACHNTWMAMVGQPVTLDGGGCPLDADGIIVSYSWDFKDGSPPESGRVVTHTYTTAGIHHPELTVTDDDGLTSTGIMTVGVFESPTCPAYVASTETRITTDPGDQYDPAIWGDIIVFTDYRSADTDVYYYDLSKSQEFPVIVAPGNQELTDVAGGNIVYTDYRSADVVVYNVSRGQTTDLTAPDKARIGQAFNSVDPSTDGTIVAWQDSRDGNMEIYAMDLVTSEERRITDATAVDARPAVSDGHIVWQRCAAEGTCDIYYYDWASKTTQQITNTPLSNERNPDMNGQNIVYQSDRNGNSDTYVYNLDTGVEKGLTLGGDQANPHIWGDNVAFDNLILIDPTTGLYHVFLWNIPSDTVFDLTCGRSGQYLMGGRYLNSIWGNRVVYTDDRNGDLEIYMTEFTYIPPVTSFTATPTSGTPPLSVQFADTSSGAPYLRAWTFGDGGTSTDPSPSHQYTGAGTYTASLTVTNPGGTSTATQTINVLSPNHPPVAEAGPDQLITVLGTTVTLNGEQSYDEDGDPLTYQWTFTSRPSGSNAVLTGAGTVSPTFIADKNGAYVVQLVVSDGKATSPPDTVTVSFQNLKPVADAGVSQSLTLGETATLDGRNSHDPNGDPLTFQWSLVSVPAGSMAQVVNPAASLTTITPDRAGTYVIRLMVNDGLVDSDPATLQILVVAKETKITTDIQDLEATITNLPSAVFKNGNMKNALINKLNAVLADISAGDYAAAISKLQNDILKKTDGCAVSGAPDSNDWITDCKTQGILYPEIVAIINELKAL